MRFYLVVWGLLLGIAVQLLFLELFENAEWYISFAPGIIGIALIWWGLMSNPTPRLVPVPA